MIKTITGDSKEFYLSHLLTDSNFESNYKSIFTNNSNFGGNFNFLDKKDIFNRDFLRVDFYKSLFILDFDLLIMISPSFFIKWFSMHRHFNQDILILIKDIKSFSFKISYYSESFIDSNIFLDDNSFISSKIYSSLPFGKDNFLFDSKIKKIEK
jgi:hypothetical protein